MEIYQPAEDSRMFQSFLKKYLSKVSSKNFQFLDVGTGSGILAKTALKFLPSKNIIALDINPKAVNQLQDQPFKAIKSNLFKAFERNRSDEALSETPKPRNPETPNTIKFDLIVFNAPYLPRDEREPKSSQVATTGGKHGDEVSLKFLKQAKSHLKPNGKILLLISSLTPQDKIQKLWPYKIVSRKKIFMEELLILKFTL